MKIEDVIRIAFNKVAKRYRGTYLGDNPGILPDFSREMKGS